MERFKKYIFLFAILLPGTVTAQIDSARYKRGSFALCYSPDLCYRTLSSDEQDQWIADLRDDEEIPKFGFTAGIAFNIFLHSRIAVSTGLFFSDKGYRTKETTLSWVSADNDFPASAHVIYHHRYLDIPLKAECYLAGKRLKFFVSAGASAGIFIMQRSVLKLEKSSGGKTKQVSKDFTNANMNFALMAGAGFSYDLTNHFTVKLEPVYRYSLSPLVPDVSIKEHLYSIGMNVSFCMRFRDRK